MFIHSTKLAIHYFDEKLRAYSGESKDFNPNEAVKRIKEWRQELDGNGKVYDPEMMDGLIYDANRSSSRDEWASDCVNGKALNTSSLI